MAIIRARNIALDMREAADFTDPFGMAGGIVSQNTTIKIGDETKPYDDLFRLQFEGGQQLWFAGNGYKINGQAVSKTLDGDDEFTAGTVGGIYAINSSGVFASIDGISVSAVELAKVAATAGTLDDKKLIEKALNGADTFDLSIRNDVAFGFGGGDNMDGNGGGDTLMGGEGNDIVDGDTGNDRLFGENGRDTLKAGTGYDQLTGGNDRDQCFGGTDSLRDLFIFNNVSESRAKDPGSDGLANDVDRVFRFTLDEDDGVNDGDGDRIWLENIDSGDADGAFEFSGETAQAHSVWWERDGKDVYVFADVTGDTKADFAILLKGLDGTLTEEAFRL